MKNILKSLRLLGAIFAISFLVTCCDSDCPCDSDPDNDNDAKISTTQQIGQ